MLFKHWHQEHLVEDELLELKHRKAKNGGPVAAVVGPVLLDENGVIADSRKEDVHDIIHVADEGDSGRLELHCQVRHVRLQLGERLFAFRSYVVLQLK